MNEKAVRLAGGDCIEGMMELDAGSVDLVVTSPPYNIGIAYGSYNDTVPREDYLLWTERWARGIERVLSTEGSFFLNVGTSYTDPWIAFEVVSRIRPIFRLQNTIHWIKSIAIPEEAMGRYKAVDHDIAVGHYKPVRGERFLNNCHEYIFHFTKTGKVPLDRLAVGVPYQDKSNIKRWKGAGRDKRCRGNTWFIPYKTIQSRAGERPHPATFPVELAEMCMRLHGVDRIRLAMDPFLGIGSSAVAAGRLGIPFVGFEIDPDYLDEAKRRVENH